MSECFSFFFFFFFYRSQPGSLLDPPPPSSWRTGFVPFFGPTMRPPQGRLVRVILFRWLMHSGATFPPDTRIDRH